MKKVFNSRQTVHVWASQTQEEGRNSSGSIFFEGSSIYSYGHHFEMARFVEGNNKSPVVLITSRSYSVTTARHLSDVHRGVSQYTSFVVPSFTDHVENLTYLVGCVREEKGRLEKARVLLHFGRMRRCLGAVQRYYTAFRSQIDAKPIESSVAQDLSAILSENFLSDEWMSAYEERRERAEAEQEKKEALRRAMWEEQARQAAIKEQAELEKWKAGESSKRYFSSTALRISGDKVETSRGAEVPTIEARMLYRMLKSGRDIVGRKVGHFTVSQLTETDIHIGCHVIPMSEVERIGALLIAEPETVGV